MTFAIISYIVTGISALVLIGLFVWRRGTFLRNVNPIINDLKDYDSNQPGYGFSKSVILTEIIEQYSRSFIDNKTESRANSHFTLDNINTVDFNLGFYSGYNNTLIGLGIFFTFVGLTIGVGYFGYNLSIADPNNQSEAISEGINVLMGGMGTAFASSVLGMFFSLWFSKNYKEKVNAIDAGLSHIANDLDSKFLKTKSDFAIERDQKLVRLIDEVMTKNKEISDSRVHNALKTSKLTYVDESDNVVGMATMTKELVAESKRQSNSLSTFSDDLAEVILDLSEKHQASSGNLAEIMRNGFKDLLETNRDPVTDLVDSLLTELNKTFAKMTDNITSSIEVLMRDLQKTAGSEVGEQADKAAKQLNEVTGELSKLPEILMGVNSQTDKTANFTKEMLTKVNETITNLQNTIELQSLAAEEIEQATKVYADKRSEMNVSLDNIKNTSRSLERTVDKFDSDFEKYTSHTTSLEEQRGENLLAVTSLVDDAAKMNVNLIENLEKIESSVEITFTNISEGLNGYHTQIKQNTNVELKAYSEAVVQITGKLQDVVNSLYSGIEDLGNSIEKMNNKR